MVPVRNDVGLDEEGVDGEQSGSCRRQGCRNTIIWKQGRKKSQG